MNTQPGASSPWLPLSGQHSQINEPHVEIYWTSGTGTKNFPGLAGPGGPLPNYIFPA